MNAVTMYSVVKLGNAQLSWLVVQCHLQGKGVRRGVTEKGEKGGERGEFQYVQKIIYSCTM